MKYLYENHFKVLTYKQLASTLLFTYGRYKFLALPIDAYRIDDDQHHQHSNRFVPHYVCPKNQITIAVVSTFAIGTGRTALASFNFLLVGEVHFFMRYAIQSVYFYSLRGSFLESARVP